MDFMLYSLKLERAFEAFGYSFPVSAGGFRSDFQSELEKGLGYLSALGIFDNTDVAILMQKYSFSDKRLEDILSDEHSKYKIDELLNQLRAWYKKYQKDMMEEKE